MTGLRLCSTVIVAALWVGAPIDALAQGEAGPAPKVTCTWIAPEAGEAIQGCGIPRGLKVEAPGAVDKLMFSRDDNPTLGRYMFRARAVGAVAKPFQRMINVARTDLVLCPSDFQKARILAFRLMKGNQIASRPTCEVSAGGGAGSGPSADGPPRVPPAGPGMEAPRPEPSRPSEPAMGAAPQPAAGDGAMEPRSVSDAIEADNPVRQRDLVQLKRAIKMDTLARLLGLLGLLFGLAASIGVVLLALSLRRRVRRLERDMDRSRASDA
ncbi:MAG: hypothetical protein RBU30_22575 [Polyangia bacterium]|jgi:hypothetical protein|nr:hypothetical protein [Polyangia bacterium]